MSTATLHSRLGETKSGLADLAPAELLEVFAAEQVRLESTTDRTATVQVGDVLPDVTLPDAHGTSVSVSELVLDGPAVLVFYRGAWCPYCNVALKAYQDEVLPTLGALDVPLAAISPQGPDGSLTIAEKNALSFPVLTDDGSTYARRLGLVFALTDDVQAAQRAFGNDFEAINAGGEWELPMPTVLVIDGDRRVTFADVHPDYTTRTEPAAILAAVRAATA
jgi:peroxiredoxin